MNNYITERKATWTAKEERAKIARQHTVDMKNIYMKEINNSIINSHIYSKIPEINRIYTNDTKILVESLDSVSGIFELADDSSKEIAVLNFASYKHPGGMFINGSKAQEECLCHESFLYNVLSSTELVGSYYNWNNKHLNRTLYTNRAVFTPNVIFTKDQKKVIASVITCAAHNKAAAQKYQNVSDEENKNVLADRIKFILSIAADNHVEKLVLGAFGSGVFGQDAKEVAEIFKELLLNDFSGQFEKVLFAIPTGNGNYEAFEEVFKDVRK